MAKSLIIVESPAKARTIKKILGRGYQVLPSMGHVKDLPKSRLGVDIEKGFAPTYVVIKERKKVLTEILAASCTAKTVYLAPYPDREGEAIAWHIAEAIRAGDPRSRKRKKGDAAPPPVEVRRVLFHEITKKGVTQGMADPRSLDRNKFDSQQARRIVDRIVGYSLSPLLWKKVRRGLSAGRVQSVAVKIIWEREKRIASFVPEEYWSLTARFAGSVPPEFTAKLVEAGGEKVRPRTGEETLVFRRGGETAPFVDGEIRKKMRRRPPPPPFTTSKLQQEGARKLRMPSYRTMMVAQSLYEGVDVPDAGLVGLITYMRKAHGETYLPTAPHVYRNRKSAQDAHEAIRPTAMEFPPAKVKPILSRDQYRLYELIWNRFVASQMAAAEFEQTAIDILCEPSAPTAAGSLFRATGSIPRFLGYLELYQEGNGERTGPAGEQEEEKDEEKAEGNILPDLSEGESLALRELVDAQHFPQPPPRFTESSLIKELEEQGIGRPSTYASIVKTIRDRGYVGMEDRKFLPTDLGRIVTELLEESFPNVMDVAFTARMEEELDQIEEGGREMSRALDDFYRPFSEELERAKSAMPELKEELIATGIPCPSCGGEMVIRFGRAGKFLACRNYPQCRHTANFREAPGGGVELTTDEEAGVACDKCGKAMVVRRWKGSRYIACSGYPECRNSLPYGTGVGCPECGEGEMVERS